MSWEVEGRESPHLHPNLRLPAFPKPSGWGQHLVGRRCGWRDSRARQTAGPRARELRRQSVLILRLLSGDHPSAPPRTLGPDCPPPARVSPDRISVGRGRTAAPAPAAGRGAGWSRCGVGVGTDGEGGSRGHRRGVTAVGSRQEQGRVCLGTPISGLWRLRSMKGGARMGEVGRGNLEHRRIQREGPGSCQGKSPGAVKEQHL